MISQEEVAPVWGRGLGFKRSGVVECNLDSQPGGSAFQKNKRQQSLNSFCGERELRRLLHRSSHSVCLIVQLICLNLVRFISICEE